MPVMLTAGAAAVDISPRTPQFLFGYPHVPRTSTGIHDPLFSSALYLSDGRTSLMMIANDVIFIAKATAGRVRARIERETGVPAGHIVVTATHTHSGPITADMISNESDPVVPKTDPMYVQQMEDGMVEAAMQAFRQARPAEIGLVVADGACVGTNRHNPSGPSNPRVPVLMVRDARNQACMAAMVVCSMHPTVLHEDSTLVSADFPGMTRGHLQRDLLGESCPVIWHTGPCGDQSPRHVTRANTFEEAGRLGTLLGQSMVQAAGSVRYRGEVALDVAGACVELPRRAMPPVTTARRLLNEAEQRLASLRASQAPRAEVRTAECDLFGAEETASLAAAAECGRLELAARSVMPAEITIARIGSWSFVFWPGETYVEFALAVQAAVPNCFVVGLANGELQGYLVTREAVEQRRYEALNALFASPESGELLVGRTLELLRSTNIAVMNP